MRAESVTFWSEQHGLVSALQALDDIGFAFGPAQPMTRTLLDTFDGRVHDAGLRLELRDSGGLSITLSGTDTVAAHVAVPTLPRFVVDLPAGPMRSRLEGIVEIRALLPIASLSSMASTATSIDRGGKVVATALAHQHFSLEHRGEHVATDVLQWAVEIDELAGYAKHARRAQRVLDGLGLSRFEGDTFGLVTTIASIDLASFATAPRVSLDPSMSAIDGFRVVLGNLSETIMASWQGTIEQVDPEYLHDLRVAIRRTRAVLAQGRKVLPPAIFQRVSEQFAWLGALTSPTRDLDVYLIEWNRYVESFDSEVVVALEPVHALLTRRRESAFAAMLEGLRSTQAREVMSSWREWLAEPCSDDVSGRHATRSLGRVVAQRIGRTHHDLIEAGRRITSDTPAEQVHDLRKQAKKLRYLFDCFGSLLPKGPRKKFVARLKMLQDILGEHQDAEVHAIELRRIALELSQRGASSDTMIAMGKLEERLDQRRAATRAQFDAQFMEYDTDATEHALDAALADIAT